MHGTDFLPSRVGTPPGTQLAQIRRMPAIEAGEEYELAKRWREHGDEEAEGRLIISQLRLVAEMAWGYRGYGLSFSKLIVEGNRSLLEAVRRFDPDSGCRLAHFVEQRIELALIDYVLASWSEVRARPTAEKMRLFFALCRRKERLAARKEMRHSNGPAGSARTTTVHRTEWSSARTAVGRRHQGRSSAAKRDLAASMAAKFGIGAAAAD